MSLNGIVERLLSIVLSWMQIIYNWFWSMLATGGQRQFMPWFSTGWPVIVAVTLALGLIIDYTVYLLRYKPEHIWIITLKRARNYVMRERPEKMERGGFRKGLGEEPPIDNQTPLYVGVNAIEKKPPMQEMHKPSAYAGNIAPDSAYSDEMPVREFISGSKAVAADTEDIYSPGDAMRFSQERVIPTDELNMYRPRAERTITEPAADTDNRAHIANADVYEGERVVENGNFGQKEVSPRYAQTAMGPRLNVQPIKKRPYGLDYDDEIEDV